MPRYSSMSLGFPPFTKAVKWLIALMAGVFLLMTLLQATAPLLAQQITLLFGLLPLAVTHGWVWQVVTYAFLHGGLFHVLFNMLALWMFGSQFEMDWGRRQFLEFFFFCVAGAALVTVGISYTGVLGLTPRSLTVGASGGIYGILLAFGVIYGDREIMLFPLPFLIKAKYFVAGLIFIALYGALQGPGGVANFCHLGGLLFGLIYVKLLPRRGLLFGLSERYFEVRNAYYRWKRRRAAKKFEVYMRKHDRQEFDEYSNDGDPKTKPPEKGNGESRGPWVN